MDANTTLRYGRKAFSVLASTFVVQPAALIFMFALASMAVTKSGPVQVAESALQEVAGLVALGPAPAGYLNMQTCADEPAKPAALDDAPALPEPVACEKQVVEAVPIAGMADKIAGVLTSTYLVAVVLALGIRFLFWGVPDLSILWRRKKPA